MKSKIERLKSWPKCSKCHIDMNLVDEKNAVFRCGNCGQRLETFITGHGRILRKRTRGKKQPDDKHMTAEDILKDIDWEAKGQP